MKDYQKNTLTWQCYMAMSVEQECLKKGVFPNGQKLNRADIEECNRRIGEHTTVLKQNNCALPVPAIQEGDQISLFNQ